MIDEVEVGNQEYKCPSCGSILTFNASKQMLTCSHCNFCKEVEFDSNVTERDFTELKSGIDDTLRTFRCSNCGAVEMYDKGEIATKCPFCTSVNMISIDNVNMVKPDSLIPFKLDDVTASKICTKWLRKRFFSPNKFKKSASIDNIKGVYYPIWTFDTNTDTSFSGTLGKHYTVTVRRNGKSYVETRTRWFNVSGVRNDMFDDMFERGSELIEEKYLQGIQPFEQKHYVKYKSSFLAGYSANNYSVDPYDAFVKAEQRMKDEIQHRIVSSYNADVIGDMHISLNHKGKSFKFLMLPIYITASVFKKKLYNQYVNGLHGKVSGKAPLSWVKILIVALLGGGVLGGLFYLLTQGEQPIIDNFFEMARILRLL